MGNYSNDSRIVLTLDAGGTNMVFGAMKGEQYVGEPITLPANANDLDLCLKTMVVGFESVMNSLGGEKPVAISFAFPGPADYPNGIIGGYLPNFPSFRDGVALGPFLEEKFGVPVFINNDGDLYAFGEALGGVLPYEYKIVKFDSICFVSVQSGMSYYLEHFVQSIGFWCFGDGMFLCICPYHTACFLSEYCSILPNDSK